MKPELFRWRNSRATRFVHGLGMIGRPASALILRVKESTASCRLQIRRVAKSKPYGEATSPRGDMPENRVLFSKKDAECLLFCYTLGMTTHRRKATGEIMSRSLVFYRRVSWTLSHL